MAYSDDIQNLGADHHWKFDGNSNDAVGSVVATDTTMSYAGSPIAKDATNSAVMDTRGDRVSLASTTTINNGAHARKAVCGWFMVDAVELPTCTIYSEGDATTNFMILIFPGNSVMLQIRDGSNFQVQVYSDIALEADRAYHFCAILEGSAYGNEVRFYIDGVEQLAADPSDRQPDDASLAIRTGAYFGDAASTGPNGVALTMDSPGDNRSTEQIINAYYQHWGAWGDTADAVLTDTEVRETLFERGALADVTLTSGTESAMQTALDVYSSTTRGNAPVCIEIPAVGGGGDFTLDVDDIQFNSLASCHILYSGTSDTLTLRNINGGECSIVAAPFGGTVEVFTEVTVQVTVKSASDQSVVEGAQVLLEAAAGGDLAVGTDIISASTNASGIASIAFDYSSNQPVSGIVRKGTSSTYFIEGVISGTITIDGLDATVLLVEDE